ncbi:hypothetical protein LTR08_005492 [Meristemomyces frigidus]|nr:hypothetical protein LTR08_005492 [Meristemomyces frigidus]
MAPPPPDPTPALLALLATTLTALAHSTALLAPTATLPTPATPLAAPPNPLHVLRDAAALTKAHTTKISLLAITAPFTPSALRKVVAELAATCLPAMLSAVHICAQQHTTWGELMQSEVQARVRRVLRELQLLLEEVRALASGQAHGARGGRDSLSSAGVVWEACDALVELAALGVAGLAVQKAEEWRATLRDAIEELREWAEGEDMETEGHDELLDEGDEGVEGDREGLLEEIFNAANSLPKERVELKVLVGVAEGKLKRVVLLYNALIKRRLRTFAGGEGSVERLDKTMGCLRRIPHLVDELASCFYDLDEAQAEAMLERCTSEAKRAALVMELGWSAEKREDEFTAWSHKWLDAIG